MRRNQLCCVVLGVVLFVGLSSAFFLHELLPPEHSDLFPGHGDFDGGYGRGHGRGYSHDDDDDDDDDVHHDDVTGHDDDRHGDWPSHRERRGSHHDRRHGDSWDSHGGHQDHH